MENTWVLTAGITDFVSSRRCPPRPPFVPPLLSLPAKDMSKSASVRSGPVDGATVLKRVKDIREHDIVILVVGLTGSGKSSLVKSLTGYDTGIGHGLTSSTDDIHMVAVPSENGRLVVVDTPGFDHTHKSDAVILAVIANWMKELYKQNHYLSGLICLCPVNRPMAASVVKPLYVTKEMAGRQAMDIIKYATTLWSSPDPGRADEQKVASQINDLINTQADQLRTSDDSAKRLLERVLEGHKAGAVLSVQKEMVEEKKHVDETTVAKKLFSPAERAEMRGGLSAAIERTILRKLAAKLKSLKLVFFFSSH